MLTACWINGADRAWYRIGEEIGVDPEVILATSHGRRAIDVLEIYQPSLANWDYVCYREGLVP
jgi:glycerol 3-phosphatase-1